MRIVLALLLILSLSSCGHYRSSTDNYRGRGEFVTGGDYPARSQSAATTYAPQGAFQLHWPVRHAKINRGFRPARDPKHAGVDFGGARGTPIHAAHEGLVIYAGRGFRGYGNMVMIEYNNQWTTLYAHLDRIGVREGQVVQPGGFIGAMGRTGRASGVHLHFELLKDKQPIDPLAHLPRQNNYTARDQQN